MLPPRSVRSALLVLVAAFGSAACSDAVRPAGRAAAARRSAVLLTLDTTRYQALTCNGGPAGVTPELDALAAEAERFTWARTVTPVTLPAHASMLTGLYPPRHTVRDNGLTPLPQSAVTLAELARDAGRETAAFVSAVVLDRAFGLDQGFDVWNQPARPQRSTTVAYAERGADEVVREVGRWLRERDPSRPYFLWVHLFDPHRPYEPAEPFASRFPQSPYLGEVAEMDHWIGELWSQLEAHGDTPFLAVVADHGEALGQHGEDTHSVFCYDSTLRVPFFLRHPDGERAGTVREELVSVVDVFPTLLRALDLAVPPRIDGRDLIDAPPDPDRGVYFESFYGYLHYGWSPLAGWVDRGGKYVHSARPELYEPRADPDERSDVVGRRSAEELDRYRAAVRAVAGRPALTPDGAALQDAELLAGIGALGYAEGGVNTGDLPHPLEDTGRASPAERRGELRAIYAALLAGERGDHAAAEAELARVVEQNPRNASALESLAHERLALGRTAEAAEALEAALALGVERSTTHQNLGYCRFAAGEFEAAAHHFERAVALDPGNEAALRNLGNAYVELGRDADVRRVSALLEELLKDRNP